MNVEGTRVMQFTHGFLQQLFQAVDVRSVPSLTFHHHAVAAERNCEKEVTEAALALYLDSDCWRVQYVKCVFF